MYPIRAPRTRCHCAGVSERRSSSGSSPWAPSRISPLVTCAFDASSPMTAPAVVDLPDPDSPTTAVIPPARMSRSTSRIAAAGSPDRVV